jgi:hypothetical protein
MVTGLCRSFLALPATWLDFRCSNQRQAGAEADHRPGILPRRLRPGSASRGDRGNGRRAAPRGAVLARDSVRRARVEDDPVVVPRRPRRPRDPTGGRTRDGCPRTHAHTIEIRSSHVAMISHHKTVTDLILPGTVSTPMKTSREGITSLPTMRGSQRWLSTQLLEETACLPALTSAAPTVDCACGELASVRLQAARVATTALKPQCSRPRMTTSGTVGMLPDACNCRLASNQSRAPCAHPRWMVTSGPQSSCTSTRVASPPTKSRPKRMKHQSKPAPHRVHANARERSVASLKARACRVRSSNGCCAVDGSAPQSQRATQLGNSPCSTSDDLTGSSPNDS